MNPLKPSIYVAGHPGINHNNIHDNTATYELYNGNAQGSDNLDATNNWWGTTDDSEIQGKIYDWFDDSTKGIADYSPVLAGPVNVSSAPQADFDADPATGAAPLAVQFTDRSGGDIDTWSWNFGDGDTSGDQNPSHTYQDSGSYTVALTVTGPGGSDSKSMTITVNPVSACDADHPGLCTTEADCTGAGGNWCNGRCQASPCPNRPPVIDSFTADPASGDAPLDVTFICTAHDPDGGIASYQWDFDGDGNTDQSGSAGTVTHTYNDAGSYQPTCTVVDNDGAAVTSGVVTVTVNAAAAACDADHPGLCTTEADCTGAGGNWCNGRCQASPCPNRPPVIDSFTADPASGDAPLDVTFICTAHDPDGGIASYQWDFDGDGNTDQSGSAGTVTHTYNDAGSYQPTCTVVDNDGAAVTSGPAKINVSQSGGNCLDEECQPGESCLCFDALRCDSMGNQCEEDEFFHIGDRFRLNLCINAQQADRFDKVDLYVAIIPSNGSILFVTSNPWQPVVLWNGGEINSDLAYRQGLEQYNQCFTLYDFEVPPGFGGTYEVYAVFNRSGHPLDVFSLLSNLAYGRVTFEEMR